MGKWQHSRHKTQLSHLEKSKRCLPIGEKEFLRGGSSTTEGEKEGRKEGRVFAIR